MATVSFVRAITVHIIKFPFSLFLNEVSLLGASNFYSLVGIDWKHSTEIVLRPCCCSFYKCVCEMVIFIDMAASHAHLAAKSNFHQSRRCHKNNRARKSKWARMKMNDCSRPNNLYQHRHLFSFRLTASALVHFIIRARGTLCEAQKFAHRHLNKSIVYGVRAVYIRNLSSHKFLLYSAGGEGST